MTIMPKDASAILKLKLSGEEIKLLHHALRNAFPNADALRLLVATEWEAWVSAIAWGNALNTIVLDLTVWAESQGKLLELVEKAYRQNPYNPALSAFATQVMRLPTISPAQNKPADVSQAVTRGPIASHSPFYIRRSADAVLENRIVFKSARHIVLHGDRNGGKTSLLNYTEDLASSLGMCVVRTDINTLGATSFASVDSFWQEVCWSLTNSLARDRVSSDFWQAGMPPAINMERFLERELFNTIPEPILWIITDTDRLFFHRVGEQNRLLVSEVFTFFRSCFELSQRNHKGKWNRLYLLVGSTFEPAHFIVDAYQSPYNVAEVIHLNDFGKDEIAALNRSYGEPLRTAPEHERFRQLLGGMPALSQLGLKLMVEEGLTFGAFEQLLLKERPPFEEHLNTLFVPLMHDSKAVAAAREIAHGRSCPLDDTFYRLRSLGIVCGSTQEAVRIRCEFYRKFILAHFS